MRSSPVLRASLPGVALFALLTFAALPVRAQAVLKVNDDVSMKFGILIQPQAEWSQDPTDGGYAQNLFLRRARFIVGGQIARNLTFFFETDAPNAGKVVGGTKQGFGMIVQDAFLSWKFRDEAEEIELLNRMLRGWANYFCLGSVSRSYRAVDMHASKRLRQWLSDKHKRQSSGWAAYTDTYLHDELGLVRLDVLSKSFAWANA